MKSSSFKLGFILVVIGFSIFTYTEVWGDDWKYFSRDDKGGYFYVPEYISHPSKNIVTVRTKQVFTEKGVMNAVKGIESMEGKHETLHHAISLYEFDCADKKFNISVMEFYSKDGKFLFSLDYYLKPPDWNHIDPGSTEERLYEIVCKQPKNKGETE
jgi:hypothetical protein